jgi:hypothetical protein
MRFHQLTGKKALLELIYGAASHRHQFRPRSWRRPGDLGGSKLLIHTSLLPGHRLF